MGIVIRSIRATHKFDWNEARKLYLGGLSLSEVGAKLGVRLSAVQYALKAMGITRRKQSTGCRHIDYNEVARLHAQGLSYRLIAGLLDRSKSAIEYALKQLEKEGKK